MHTFKPLLSLGSLTMVERTVRSLWAGCTEELVVVTGYRSDDVEPLVTQQHGARCIYNNKYAESDMLHSICIGLNALQMRSDAVFLLPVDVPLVKAETLASMAAVFRSRDIPLLHPTYLQKKGHPPLIGVECIDSIITYAGSEGLKGALRQFELMATQIEVDDQGILMDADTNEDYLYMCNYDMDRNVAAFPTLNL
jgi:molybdenum cofactor cytidylyltransferase